MVLKPNATEDETRQPWYFDFTMMMMRPQVVDPAAGMAGATISSQGAKTQRADLAMKVMPVPSAPVDFNKDIMILYKSDPSYTAASNQYSLCLRCFRGRRLLAKPSINICGADLRSLFDGIWETKVDLGFFEEIPI